MSMLELLLIASIFLGEDPNAPRVRVRCIIWALLIAVTVSPAVVSFIRGLPTLFTRQA